MKILFISSWYPNDKNPNYGVFIKEHAHAIYSSGNDILVLAIIINKDKIIFSKSINEYKDENGIRTIIVNINTRFRDIVYRLISVQYIFLRSTFLKRIYPDFNPEIIHSNVIFPAGIIGDKLSKFLKKPHIITEHWSRIKGLMKKPFLSSLAIEAYSNANAILPVSLFLQQNMLDILPLININKFHIVGNVIDSKTFYYVEKAPNPTVIKFCAIATWANKKVPDKIPELFIESQLQKTIRQTFKLTMIGGGDKIDELAALCKNKNLNAEFKGFQDKTRITQYLQESDYFVHASTVETFGVGIAEALYCGTPVICSNVGALPELINESNGVLCNNTVNDWIFGIQMAISKLYNNSEISNKIKSKYSLESIGRKINDVYIEII